MPFLFHVVLLLAQVLGGSAQVGGATVVCTTPTAGQVDTPTATPSGGTFSGSQLVTVTNTTPGAAIYFTTDLSTPSTSSTVESGGTAASAPACTIWVSTTGSSSVNGRTVSAPTTLTHAPSVTVPGDVVCIAPGTYDLAATFYPLGGTSSNWITYTSYQPGIVDLLWTAGAGASDETMIHMYNATFPGGPSYLIFQGLTLDGQNVAENGFFCQGSHHIKYLNNAVSHMGAAGIGSVQCDYQTSDHNLIYHSGYNAGWSSGISYNSNQFFDAYSGLHNIVSNNVVAGEFDNSSNHSDGNGIIMDLSNGTQTYASTPPGLIVNNVVYGNGGRCIVNNYVTSMWVVNNTCYSNMLDLTLGTVGEIVNQATANSYYVNNAVYSWNSEPPLRITTGAEPNTGLTWTDNVIFGGTPLGGVPSGGYTTANPNYVNPPPYAPGTGGQYATTINPSVLGNALQLQAGSPAIGAGIDPSTLTTDPNLVADLKTWIYTDINGVKRGTFAAGAYQYQLGTLLYTGPFYVNTGTTINAIGAKTGYTNSPKLSATFTFTIP